MEQRAMLRSLVTGAAVLGMIGPTSPLSASSARPAPPEVSVHNVSQTPDLAEGEQSIAINPVDPKNILIGSNQFQPFPTGTPGVGFNGVTSSALWRSHDGGQTWAPVTGLPYGGLGPTPNPVGTGPPEFKDPGNVASGDQDVVFDREGRAYFESLYLGTSPREAVVRVVRSGDGGLSWSAPATPVSTVAQQAVPDRPFLAVDQSGGSRDGNVYLTWETVFFEPLIAQVYIVASRDHGLTWGPVVRVDDDANNTAMDPRQTVAIDGQGAIYDLYTGGGSTLLAADPRANDIGLVLARSDDGGRSFTHSSVATHVVRAQVPDEGGLGPLSTFFSALAADPRRPGHVAVAWLDGASGTAQMRLQTSIDAGNHWTAARDITGLSIGGGVQTDHIRLAYLSSGDLAVVWRDRRLSAGSFTDPFDVWLRILGSDGELRPGPPRRLTGNSQPTTTNHYGFASEYLGLAAGPDMIAAAWDQLVGPNWTDNFMTTVPVTELRSDSDGGNGSGLPNTSAGVILPIWSGLLGRLREFPP